MHFKNFILLIANDKTNCANLMTYLERANYQLQIACKTFQALKLLRQHHFDLILLGSLPDTETTELCTQIRRESDVPIIVIAEKDDEIERIINLEIGADDCLAKPINPRELLARMKSLLRRNNHLFAIDKNQPILKRLPNIKFAGWILDRNNRFLIAPNGDITSLSAHEYRLLIIFLQNPQRILTRDQLLEQLHGKEAGPFDRSIDVLIGRIRKKIEVDYKKPAFICTARGSGYKFNCKIEVQS